MDGLGCTVIDEPVFGLLDAMTRGGLAQSNGAGRKLVAGGGVSVNGSAVAEAELRLDWRDALHGRYYLLRRGKKNWHMVRRGQLAGG
jgi:tyrosyl-tRNA synthetase